MTAPAPARYGERVVWQPARPQLRPARLLLSWFTAAISLLVAAALVPGVAADGFWGALGVAVVVAVLNALLPPLLAALRLPFMLVFGFVAVLLADAAMLWLASDLVENAFAVDSFWWALVAALVASAVSLVLAVVFGANDDDAYTLRVTQRIARRSGERVETDVPGILFLEIDGLALPVLQRAMRDGSARTMARWLEEGCAFEELISFHGGIGGPQTRPFLLYPSTLPPPPLPLVGAAAVHGVLTAWRERLQGDVAPVPVSSQHPRVAILE